MNRKWLLISLAIIVLAVLSLITIDYLALFKTSSLETTTNQTRTSTSYIENNLATDYEFKVVAENLFVPWSLEFIGEDRILVTERPGRIREIINGRLLEDPLVTFKEVHAEDEEGLMGMTKDPNYDENRYIYVCLAYQKSNSKLVDKVVRFVDPRFSDDQNKVNSEIILDNIPAARFHAGCRLKFGPDNKLYITTGDATDRNLAQDLNSLAGKILRLNPDGSVPKDNPFPNSYIYSYGHRNPQGIAWHPITNDLWSTEHGPSVFDGPAGGDEVNLIIAGENFGWPLVSHESSQPGLVSPKIVFTPAEAPASAMFYDRNIFPQFKNNLFFGALRGEKIVRIFINSSNPSLLDSYEALDLKGLDPGRIREITQGPDGLIYFTTSNMDGRGEIRTGDDKIYQIIPLP